MREVPGVFAHPAEASSTTTTATPALSAVFLNFLSTQSITEAVDSIKINFLSQWGRRNSLTVALRVAMPLSRPHRYPTYRSP